MQMLKMFFAHIKNHLVWFKNAPVALVGNMLLFFSDDRIAGLRNAQISIRGRPGLEKEDGDIKDALRTEYEFQKKVLARMGMPAEDLHISYPW